MGLVVSSVMCVTKSNQLLDLTDDAFVIKSKPVVAGGSVLKSVDAVDLSSSIVVLLSACRVLIKVVAAENVVGLLESVTAVDLLSSITVLLSVRALLMKVVAAAVERVVLLGVLDTITGRVVLLIVLLVVLEKIVLNIVLGKVVPGNVLKKVVLAATEAAVPGRVVGKVVGKVVPRKVLGRILVNILFVVEKGVGLCPGNVVCTNGNVVLLKLVVKTSPVAEIICV